VLKRDTITSYDIQCPASIGELGLSHTEQIALLEKVQNILLVEQALLLAPAMPGHNVHKGRYIVIEKPRRTWSNGMIHIPPNFVVRDLDPAQSP